MNQTIPRQEWTETCHSFGNRHRGWLARILVMPTAEVETGAAHTGAREVAMAIPLREVIATEEGGEPWIQIVLGEGKAEATHQIRRPRALKRQYAPNGDEMGLRVDDALGETTLVRFPEEVTPEAQGGVASVEL